MEKERTYRSIFVEIITFLYILLFVYAAVSKLIDFENFRVQLGQSPLLSAFAGWVAWAVPVVELLIVVILLFPKFRLIGLWAAFCLMVMFTAYIFIILNFSPFVPCSCGGILEKLGWTEHLVFNVVFIILAAAGILILAGSAAHVRRKMFAALAGKFAFTTLGSIGIVVLLFALSEDMMHHRNNFIRRYTPLVATLRHEYDLTYNSYYLAGIEGDSIYIANPGTPLVITVIDTTLTNLRRHTVTLPESKLLFRSLRTVVRAPYFYIYDGMAPAIFRGRLGDWKAETWLEGEAYFTALAPMGPTGAVIRAQSSRTHESVLGTVTITDTTMINFSDKLLEKQIDGVFDTDGMLLYNKEINRLIYGYYYRNEYVVADTLLQLSFRGNTIDSTKKARIEVARRGNVSTLASPARNVNKSFRTSGNSLYVHSALIGKYEPKEIWKSASVVDVYDLTDQSYVHSFYVYDKMGEKMREFEVSGDLLVSLAGRYLGTYRLRKK